MVSIKKRQECSQGLALRQAGLNEILAAHVNVRKQVDVYSIGYSRINAYIKLLLQPLDEKTQ